METFLLYCVLGMGMVVLVGFLMFGAWTVVEDIGMEKQTRLKIQAVVQELCEAEERLKAISRRV